MAGFNPERAGWRMERDEEGHRTYFLTIQVHTDDPDDGPAVVFDTPGLPLTGSSWSYGNDDDPWAFCYPTMTIRPHRDEKENEPGKLWLVEQTFSTKPLKRCQDTTIENPLNEPPRISGAFSKFTEPKYFDLNGNPFINSALQSIAGPATEFDANRPSVRISMNIPSLPLATIAQMVDSVNSSPMWGVAARCVKLSNVSWERVLYGTCTFYYVVNYEFEINFATWDRNYPDQGDMVKEEGGDPENPKDFERAVDKKGNLVRVFLDGAGNAVDSVAEAANISMQYYPGANFFILGIPATL